MCLFFCPVCLLTLLCYHIFLCMCVFMCLCLKIPCTFPDIPTPRWHTSECHYWSDYLMVRLQESSRASCCSRIWVWFFFFFFFSIFLFVLIGAHGCVSMVMVLRAAVSLLIHRQVNMMWLYNCCLFFLNSILSLVYLFFLFNALGHTSNVFFLIITSASYFFKNCLFNYPDILFYVRTCLFPSAAPLCFFSVG